MGTVTPVKVEDVSEEMRQYVKANTHNRTDTEEESRRKVLPVGYAALLEAAQTGSKVPLFLFERGEQGSSTLAMTLGLSDLDAINEMEFTTDASASKCLAVITIGAEQLPKDWILNPEDLPCDEKGAVRWDKILDDVCRNEKHYNIWVDWQKVKNQEVNVQWRIMTPQDVQVLEEGWREGLNDKALGAYVRGLFAMAKLDLAQEKDWPSMDQMTPDQKYAFQLKAKLDMIDKAVY